MGRRGLEVVLVPTGDDQKVDMQRANKIGLFWLAVPPMESAF